MKSCFGSWQILYQTHFCKRSSKHSKTISEAHLVPLTKTHHPASSWAIPSYMRTCMRWRFGLCHNRTGLVHVRSLSLGLPLSSTLSIPFTITHCITRLVWLMIRYSLTHDAPHVASSLSLTQLLTHSVSHATHRTLHVICLLSLTRYQY